MQYTKSAIKEVIKNSRGEANDTHADFLEYVCTRLKDGPVSDWDFAEQIKRSARDMHDGCVYDCISKTCTPLPFPLVCNHLDPMFSSIRNFVADIHETILKLFSEEFAKKVIIFLPERTRNQLVKKEQGESPGRLLG
jgi:hypothetical protein